VVARIFLHIIPEIEKEGYGKISMEKIEEVMEGLKKKYFAKEAVEKILIYMAQNPSKGREDAMKECGVVALSPDDARKIIRQIIEERKDFVREKKENAISALMGVAMKSLRGKMDGSMVNNILREELKKYLEEEK